VTAIELTEDHKHAIVHAQLLKREDSFATKGATFWIVRPEVSEAGLSGLGTLFSGPYINSLPGKDEETLNVFTGMSKPPRPYEEGEHFILTTPKLGHVQDGSSVYYKGVPVGSVQEVELANEADHLDVHVVVWSRYAALVRENSKFWVVSGFDFKGGLFSGAELRLDSLKTVVSGGIAFGTPEKEVKAQAKTGFHFVLEDSPQKDWEAWSPRISISPKSGDTASKPIELPTRKLERKK
jgi:paraquat-inducible protein B